MILRDDLLQPGQVELLDALTPALQDGVYSISVSQTVSAPGASIPAIQQQVIVAGPRFTLDPADLATVFPPAGSSGQFANVLPHVVANKRVLAWERSIPGLASCVPWLAVMIFDEGDLIGSGNGLQTMTVEALLNQQPANVRVPTLTDVSADELASSCSVITLSSSTFVGIVPTGRELPYLAHARVVDMSAKASSAIAAQGVVCVVVANRFASPGAPGSAARCVAHLVSLEGFGDLLGGVRPVVPEQQEVMLVSLYSWTFSCIPETSQTFLGLARNLIFSDENDTPRPVSSLLLQLPFTNTGATDPATTLATQRLNSGYVPLGYHAQTGEDGFAWYRGPFSPVVPNTIQDAGALVTASAAMIYDSTYGVFDHSLAAAFQCGETLALASQTYATALMRLRMSANSQLDQMVMQGTRTPKARQEVGREKWASVIEKGLLRSVARASHGIATPRQTSRPRRTLRKSSAMLHAVRAALARPEIRGALSDALDQDPDAIAVADWLGLLQLLEGVPFVHLVPCADMLPPESIRFFYVDANWIAALVAGAVNIGLGSSRELAVQGALTSTLDQLAAAVALGWRANTLGQPVPPAASGPLSGLLIRSALVVSWPGLTVTATLQNEPVALLRLDLLSPGVMLCLFNGVPDQVTLTQPHEALAFGVDDDGNSQVRVLSGSSLTTQPGPLIYDSTNPRRALATIRDGGLRVLNLNVDPGYPSTAAPTNPVDLLGTVARALNEGTASVGPACFALQMIAGPEQITFTLNPENVRASGEVSP